MACNGSNGLRETHLHGDLSVIDHDLPRQEISADGGLVARTKLLLDLHASASASSSGPGATVQHKRPGHSYILVHQARLADTAISEDDNLFGPSAISVSSRRVGTSRVSRIGCTLRRTFFREAMFVEFENGLSES